MRRCPDLRQGVALEILQTIGMRALLPIALSTVTLAACAVDPTETPEQDRPSVDQQSRTLPSEGFRSWIAYANELRTAFGSPRIVEDPALSRAARRHAEYVVRTDEVGHSEDRRSPHYSDAGHGAAERGLPWGTYEPSDFARAFDAWQQAPFHLLPLLDPSYRKMGWGEFLDTTSPGLVWGVTLVLRPADYVAPYPKLWAKPMVWPPRGYETHVARHWGETPSPLTACGSSSSEAGLPLIASFGWWTDSGATRKTTLVDDDGRALAHCRIDARTFTYPDRHWQEVGTAILRSYDAVFIVPRAPFEPKRTYRAGVERASGAAVEWKFSIGPVLRRE